MRVARRMFVLALAAVGAMALMAGTASAQTVEITDEGSGEHCGAVTVTDHAVSGGCSLQAVSLGEVHLFANDAETLCNNNFEARIDEDGHGYIYDQVLTNGPSQACFVTPCAEPSSAQQPWDVETYEDNGLKLDAEFCVEDIFFHGETHCLLEGIDVTVTGHDHVHYTTNGPLTGQVEGGGECIVDGEWESTVDTEHPELEIEHL